MEVLWTVFRTLWRTGASASLLIAAVLIARMILIHRLPKRTFSLLWTICICRILIPVTLESPINIRFLFREKLLPGFAGNASLFGEEGAAFTGSEIWAGNETHAASGIAAAITGGTPAAGIWAAIWLLGAMLLGTYFLSVYVRYRRMFAESLPLEVSVEWESGLMRPISLRSSDRISAPLSYGLFRPVILFPVCMNWEDENLTEMILAHEAVHIRRLDGLLKGMMALSLCLYWYNPLMWLMFFLGSCDMELACDEAVVLESEGDLRREYALALIRMEERRGTCGRLYSHFSENAIEERITAIMKIKKTTGLALVCALCLVIGLTAVFATDAPDAAEDGDLSTAGEELIWPAEDCDRITAAFGERVHPVTGEIKMYDHMTIAASGGSAKGAAVSASASGTVVEAEYSSTLGYYAAIDHGNGLMTKYTYCQELLVTEGQTVKQGETIASVGATGMVTGPCLGFYVYQDGEAMDPKMYLE